MLVDFHLFLVSLMVQFDLRKPIQTRSPTIEVDPGLSPGSYRFSLVVTDETGNESEPDFQTVVIQQLPVRMPVINPIRDVVINPTVVRDPGLNRTRINEVPRDRFPN